MDIGGVNASRGAGKIEGTQETQKSAEYIRCFGKFKIGQGSGNAGNMNASVNVGSQSLGNRLGENG